MARGQKETSTNQVGRKKGTPRKSPTTSSMVVVMSLKELRSFFQILADISLELLDGVAVSIVGGENNAAYFTQEQFAARLHFPISSLVKQFLHFTRVSPMLIHLNIFQILMGCSMLKFLY